MLKRTQATTAIYAISLTVCFAASAPCWTTSRNAPANANPLGAVLGAIASTPSTQTAFAQGNTSTSPKTFREWCLEKANQTPQVQKTIDALLLRVQTQDCTQASRTLRLRTTLDLTNASLTDLSPLSSLTQLTSLNLAGNLVTDLRPLTFLTRLTSLDLTRNYFRDVDAGTFEIKDFSPLASLSQLTNLNLSYNQIRSLNSLPSLKQLTNLNLSNNQITDLKFLASLPKLVNLDLSNNYYQTYDIDGVSERITDLGPLFSFNVDKANSPFPRQ